MTTHTTLALPRNTKVIHATRVSGGWQLWVSTRDMVHGTFWFLADTGAVTRVTSRPEEGDDVFELTK